MRLLLIALVSSLPVAQPAQQSRGWLPAPVEEAVVTQLVERLSEIGLGEVTSPQLKKEARDVVQGMRAKLETWQAAETMKRAPALEALELPAAGDRRLDAMARYQMCNTVYFIRHARRDTESNEDARIGAVMGMTAGTMALLVLRDAYIRGGGPEAQVEKFLTSDALQPALDRIQGDLDVLRAVNAECAPVIRDLISRR